MNIILILISVVIICIFLRIYQKRTNGVCTSEAKLIGKVALITGGTSGMGLEVAKDFARRGAKVIIACPFKEEGNAALNIIENETTVKVDFQLLNLASFESVRKFANNLLFNEAKLDILVNNAGGKFSFTTEDGLSATLQINYFGHFLLTLLLLPLIKKGDKSRIVNVGSLLHWVGYVNLENLNKIHWLIQYNSSKLYLLYFTNELRKKLKNSGVIVNCVDPGAVGTNIWNFIPGDTIPGVIRWFLSTFYKTPIEGAQNTIFAAVDDTCTKGGYVKDCRYHNLYRSEIDKKSIDLFWNQSLDIVQLDKSNIEY